MAIHYIKWVFCFFYLISCFYYGRFMRYSVVTDLCTNEAVRLQSFTILTPMRPQTNIKTVLPIKAYLRKWEAMLERVKVKQNNAYCVLRGFTR